jgi:Flp pilus assembly protein TadD
MGLLPPNPDPQAGDLLYAQGVAALEADRLEDAVEAFRSLVDCQPDHADAWDDLGVIMEALGNPGEALRCYRRALDANPEHAGARSNLMTLALNLELAARVRRQAFTSMFLQ